MVKIELVFMLLLVIAVALSTSSSHARSLVDSTTSFPTNNPPLLDYEKTNFSPYKECIQSCKNCACTQVWPPDLSLCVCLDSGKVKEKPKLVPSKECSQSCQTACACTLVYPPELSQCICLDPSRPTTFCQSRRRRHACMIFRNHNQQELSNGNEFERS